MVSLKTVIMEPESPGDSQAPDSRERVQRPDYAAHETKLRQLDQEIAGTKTALVRIKARLESQGCTDKRSSKALIDRLTAQKKQWHDERSQQNSLLTLCDSDLTVLHEEQRLLRSRVKLASEAELDCKLEELRRRQEHTTMSLKEEKRILAEIRELELSRPTLIAYVGKGLAVAGKEADRAAIREQIKALWDKINATKRQIDEEWEKLRKSESMLQSELPQLKAQRDELVQRLYSLDFQRTSLLEAFTSQVKDYRKQAKILKFVQLLEKRLQSGPHRSYTEEAIVDPYQHRKEKIDFAIAWFHRLLPRPEAVITGRRGRKKGTEAVPMSIEMATFLAGLRVRAPGNASEIPATISALRQHRESLESEALFTPSPCPPDSSTQPSSKVSPHEDEERPSAPRGRGRWGARKQ